MTVKIQGRDRELLAALSTQVSVLSFEQVARGWFGRTEDPKGTVSRRLRTLAKDHHLHVFEAVSGPEFDFTGPQVEWAFGAQPPNPAALLEVVERRRTLSTRSRRFVAASRAKAALLAERSPEVLTHELNLATLFLRLRAEREGWKAVPSLVDPRLSAAIDASGDRIEVASPALMGKLEALVRASIAGLSIW